MFPAGWTHFVISEIFLVASIVLLQMSTKAPPSSYLGLAMWLCSVIAIWMLGRAMANFDLSSLFALWLGIAIPAVAIIAMVLFKEQVTIWRTLSIAVTTVGIVGICITSTNQ
ncbi:hypothetical protein MACH09_40600 [Vibrio sp. MACH09]|uniref:SMR family transporter n=1 Tax=unclassified Vibrio TaxID=2614977 RepID=UPI001493BC2F|nr:MULTISPECIES: SMR family transporter [unclassified Vibrio]NOI68625.1 hypothetical protein [Vibrio sp. 99-8-1]GLO63552.1 hypothetical protein MACH09_40600 [Vibrio sp. MACH09]